MLQIQFFTIWSRLFFNVANISQNPGQNTYASSIGFLSNSIDALRLVMSSVLSTKPWLRDPEVVTIPWREALVQSTLSRASIDGSSNHNLPLKLGIYWTDSVVSPQPPIIRGLHTVVDTLRRAGHKASCVRSVFLCPHLISTHSKVVDWNPPPQSTAKRVHVSCHFLF